MLLTRRQMLHRLACLAATPFVLAPGWTFAATAKAAVKRPVFDLGVASGDPSATGVMLWTRINPDSYDGVSPLYFQVATDSNFLHQVTAGMVDAADFSDTRDYTVRIDTKGLLKPGRRYYYRFIYRDVGSPRGRCRTLPGSDADLAQLRLGVITCQDYTNGYYPAFKHLAEEKLDFVVHLGDFIYESTDDARFQNPLPGRTLDLPSGAAVVQGIEDYRAIYRTYRRDRHFQRALRNHTWIVIWDDHEFANDCYYDWDTASPAAPDHPFNDAADPAASLTQLKLDSQQAWAEYVPTRVPIDLEAENPLERLSIYRRFRFGRLADLFLTDERSYRNGPPCGLSDIGGRILAPATPACQAAVADPSRSMLGEEQKAWLIDGLAKSKATWKLWGNEVQLQPLTIGLSALGGLLAGLGDSLDLLSVLKRLRDALPGDLLYVNLDAWDGYQAERQEIAAALQARGVGNLIALTGDFHTALVGYLKADYSRPNRDLENRLGVEFMTPAITSANLQEVVAAQINNATPLPLGITVGELFGLISGVLLKSGSVHALNNSIMYFDSAHWGYSVLELNKYQATFTIYAVDKETDDPNTPKKVLVQYVADSGVPNLRRTTGLSLFAAAEDGTEGVA